MQWQTVEKGIFCALRPHYWPHLRKGVAPAIEHIGPLSRFDFRTVVDVGANRGQFALMARALYPTAQIYSFEPLSGPAAVYRALLSGDDRVHLFDTAIGASSGMVNMYVTTRDDSSSLLKPGASQDEIFGVQASRVDEVSIRRLSECVPAGRIERPALLKIDVQGAELTVLEGAADVIDGFAAIYVECSYLQLYDEQPLIGDIARWADQHGFRLAGVYNQHDDPDKGPVQADFLFLNGRA
jgi:FkbM family methyltransferase